jgi:hypothetical protein
MILVNPCLIKYKIVTVIALACGCQIFFFRKLIHSGGYNILPLHKSGARDSVVG